MLKHVVAACLVLTGCGSNVSDGCLAPSGGSPGSRLVAHGRHEESNGFLGSVLIVEGASVLLDEDFGEKRADGSRPAYWIASISKAITAVAVMRLVEQGEVSLEAPLSTWFPAASLSYDRVTVHHLLSHRSGLPSEYAADGVSNRDSAARAIFRLAPVKPMGEFFYSNDGYSLLAMLIERVTGDRFEDFVRREVFAPAGMSTAGFWGEEPLPSPVVLPLRPPRSPRVWQDGHSIGNYGYRGPTGIYATPADLYRFAAAFTSGRLVSPATVALMLASKNPALGPNSQSYGYGWALKFRDGQLDYYWHGGNENPLGHNGQLRISGDQVIVVLSSSGEVDGVSWAQRMTDGMLACMH